MVQYRIDAVSLWVAGRRVRLVSKRLRVAVKKWPVVVVVVAILCVFSQREFQLASNKSLGNFHMSLASQPQLSHQRHSGQLNTETKPTISAVNRRENLCVYFLA